MEPRITVITLGVDDLPRAVAFYRDGLGLPLERLSGDGVAYFDTQGTRLALFPRTALADYLGVEGEATPPGPAVLSHNVREPAAVEDVLRRAEAAGGRVLRPAADTAWGGHAGVFADPDGHLWEVVHNPGWTPDP